MSKKLKILLIVISSVAGLALVVGLVWYGFSLSPISGCLPSLESHMTEVQKALKTQGIQSSIGENARLVITANNASYSFSSEGLEEINGPRDITVLARSSNCGVKQIVIRLMSGSDAQRVVYSIDDLDSYRAYDSGTNADWANQEIKKSFSDSAIRKCVENGEHYQQQIKDILDGIG
jgi:hypothetical protein